MGSKIQIRIGPNPDTSRAQAISSSVQGKHEETKQALTTNGYPREVIQCHPLLPYQLNHEEGWEERGPIVMLCVWCVKSNEACPEPTGCQGHLPTKCDTQTLDEAERLCVLESDRTGVIRIRFPWAVCLPPMWGIYIGKVPQSEVEEVQT